MFSNEERGCGHRVSEGVGTSTILSPLIAPRTIISLANSIPVVCNRNERIDSVVEGAQTAVKVADRNLEKEPAKETERRISEIPMDEMASPRAQFRPGTDFPSQGRRRCATDQGTHRGSRNHSYRRRRP